jgi:putative transposase
MDDKGYWRDDVFIERFRRTVKYEEVNLRAYECTTEARDHLTRYLRIYNQIRSHPTLDEQTPDQGNFESINPAALAA